jgi:hypothetical protein
MNITDHGPCVNGSAYTIAAEARLAIGPPATITAARADASERDVIGARIPDGVPDPSDRRRSRLERKDERHGDGSADYGANKKPP